MAITWETQWWKARDGVPLYGRYFRGSQKIAIALVHGLNEHSGRYADFADFLASHGYSVILWDHRGHGRSDGFRGDIDRMDRYREDAEDVLKAARRLHLARRFVVLGHSMGGQIAAGWVAKTKLPVVGLITSSANFKALVPVRRWEKALGHQVRGLWPRIRLRNRIRSEWISRDPDVVKAYDADPLVGHSLTLRLGDEILRDQESLASKASLVRVPCLLLHGGDDRICAVEGTKNFYESLGPIDKTLKIYPSLYHEILNDPEKKLVWTDILHWLSERFKDS